MSINKKAFRANMSAAAASTASAPVLPNDTVPAPVLPVAEVVHVAGDAAAAAAAAVVAPIAAAAGSAALADPVAPANTPDAEFFFTAADVAGVEGAAAPAAAPAVGDLAPHGPDAVGSPATGRVARELRVARVALDGAPKRVKSNNKRVYAEPGSPVRRPRSRRDEGAPARATRPQVAAAVRGPPAVLDFEFKEVAPTGDADDEADAADATSDASTMVLDGDDDHVPSSVPASAAAAVPAAAAAAAPPARRTARSLIPEFDHASVTEVDDWVQETASRLIVLRSHARAGLLARSVSGPREFSLPSYARFVPGVAENTRTHLHPVRMHLSPFLARSLSLSLFVSFALSPSPSLPLVPTVDLLR
jgi:hypothetical protein